MDIARIQSAIAQDAERKLKAEIKSLKKTLDSVTTALVRAREPRRSLKLTVPTKRPARLKGDFTRLIIPDTHGMKVAKKPFGAVLADAKMIDPKHVVLLGDHLDCGGFLAQHHPLGYVSETNYSYDEDIEAANEQFDRIQEAASNAEIEEVEGNHERRVEGWCVNSGLRNKRDAERLRRAMAPEFVLRLKERGIKYYRVSEFYDGLDVPGIIKRGSCFFLHGITTSKHAAFVTRVRTAGNCVHGHTHRAQSDIGRMLNVGTVGVWCPGCLCEQQPIWQHGSPTDWTHGYAVQFVSRTGKFLHLNVPVVDGVSMFCSLLKH